MDQVGKTVYRANGGHAYEKEKYLLFSKFFLIMPVPGTVLYEPGRLRNFSKYGQ